MQTNTLGSTTTRTYIENIIMNPSSRKQWKKFTCFVKFKKTVEKNSHVLSSTKNCTGVVGNGYAYELVRPGSAAAAGVDCDGAVWRGANTLK